tara:strand:+ start:1715 stop:2023 length:309 start_codon:yes stop_codon:yes gene_type:complete
MKKGKITQTENACIRGMLANEIEVKAMAKQLDRSLDLVQKEVDSIEAEIKRDQLIINKSAKGHKGVAIMTPQASMQIDSRRENSNGPDTSSKVERSIHTIHG